MMEPQPIAWRLPDELSLEDFVAALEAQYSLQQEPLKQSKQTYFDTFDWRLYQKDLLLCREGSAWRLFDTNGVSKASLRAQRKTWCFSWDIPDSELRNILSGIIAMRALLPLVSFTLETTSFRVLNRDEKTVAQIVLRNQELDNDSGGLSIVYLKPIRGYTKEFDEIAAFLGRYESEGKVTAGDELKAALQGTGRVPLDYSSKLDLHLDPAVEGRAAVKSIYSNLLATMLRNEQGIFDDLDSEFLHDFRVAIRRTRSALSLIKGTLEPEVETHFAKEFKYLGQITGPTRDLDVYLLMEDNYKARLPERLQEGLVYFFEDLAERRKKEQRKLVQALRSRKYKQIIGDWQKYLEGENAGGPSKNSAAEIGSLASKIIYKRFKRVLKDGRAIHADTPDENLHRLRIQGKKLRYSLEFFTSLYPEDKMVKLIKQLKVLQNNLGDFNDLSVQQDMLRHYLATIRPGSKRNKELTASIGGLLTNLYHQHNQVRTHFEESFAVFADQENIALYKTLFA